MLTTFAKGHRGDWDEHLPFVMLAYRSTVHESTGYMPNQMVFGREVTLPVDLMFGSPPQAGDMPACPVIYVEWLRAALENDFEYARKNLRKSAERQKRFYDHKAREPLFKVGDWVYRYYPPAARAKFGSGWTGPYLVTKVISDLVYEIQLSRKSKPKVVHADDLKMCAFDPQEGGPQEVDDRQEEGWSLADLEVSDKEPEGEAPVDNSGEDPSIPNVEVQVCRGRRNRKPNPRYFELSQQCNSRIQGRTAEKMWDGF